MRFLRSLTVAAITAVLLTGFSASAGSNEVFVDGELIVGLTDGFTIDTINTLHGTNDVQYLPQLNIWQINTPPGANIDSMAEIIEQEEFVDFCHPNYRVDPLEPVQGSIPFGDEVGEGDYAHQTAASTLQLDDAQLFSSGSGISVAVIDGGINFDHPAFAGMAVSGWDYVDDDPYAYDEPGGLNVGHGTFVAGVIHLVAPLTEIISYRVTNPMGASNGYLVAEAILQAVADGCRLINLSMVMMGQHEAIAAAVQHARDNNVMVVVAAGNGGTEDARYPATDINTIAVAAVDSVLILADFSSFGDYIDICAPGTRIYSPYLNDGYAWWGGTSFSSPFVSAMAALLLSYDETLTWQQLRDTIAATAIPLDSINEDFNGLLGAGLIDPLAALLALRGGAITINVPGDYPTINEAVDSAYHGDTILVAPGTYYGKIYYDNKAVHIISSGGPEVTILKPMFDDSRIVYMGGSFIAPPELRGFTLTGLYENYAVLEISGHSGLVSECIFHSNSLNDESMPAIEIYRASPTISNCLFYNNGGRAIKIGSYAEGTHIINNTFDNNFEGIYDYSSDSSIIIRNNVITNCSTYGIHIAVDGNIDYNNLWNNDDDYSASSQAGIHDIHTDPLYVDTRRHNYHLLPGTSCLDTGDPDSQYNDPDGSRSDIGAFPVEIMTTPLPTQVTVSPEESMDIVSSLTPQIEWVFYDSASTTQTRYHLQVGTDNDWTIAEMWDTGEIWQTINNVLYDGLPLNDFSTYYYRLRLHNGNQWGDWCELSFSVSVGGVINVPSMQPTIQAAIDVASEGDTIFVAPGTYMEQLSINDKNLILLSTWGPDSTTIESPFSGQVLIDYTGLIDTSSLIQGFTIKGGSIGINTYFGCSPRIIGNTITEASLVGIYADDPYGMIISDNLIDNNAAAIELHGGTGIIQNNIITNNETSSNSYGIISLPGNDNSLLSGNIIAHNGNIRTLYVCRGTGNIIENNTLYGNHGGGMEIRLTSDAIIRNNLVAFNTGGAGISQIYANDSLITYEYNNSYGNFPTDWLGVDLNIGNISSDPLFADTLSDDCNLLPGSPCVDAGHPDPEYNDPNGTRNDIGAVPLGTVLYPLASNIILTPNDSGIVTNNIPDFHWSYVDTSASTQAEYQLQVGTDMEWDVAEMWSVGPVNSADTFLTYTGAPLEDFTIYFARLRVSDGTFWGDWSYTTFQVKIATVIYVPADFTTIQAAMNIARSGDTILVAPGTYQEQVYFRGRDVYLKATDGPEVTFIAPVPDVQYRVFFTGGETIDAIVEGFGFVDEGYGVYFKPKAGGTVRNNRFIGLGNTAISTDWDNTGVLENNYFEGCHRAVYLNSGYWQITHNTFYGNYATNNGGTITCQLIDSGYVAYNIFTNNQFTWRGGAIVVQSRGGFMVHNNTIVNNTADDTTLVGAIYIDSYYGNCTIINNIIASNKDMYGINDHGYSSTLCEYNNVFNNELGDYCGEVVAGVGSISIDPAFVDTSAGDFSLMPSSPCIDAGHPGFEWVDPDGSINDMGAIPYDGPINLPIAKYLNATPGDLTHLIGQTPTLFWTFYDTLGTPSGYEIEIGTDNEWSTVEMWSSGQIMTSDTSAVYAGTELIGGTTYFLRIRLFNGSVWGDWRGSGFHSNAAPTTPTMISPAYGDTVGIVIEYIIAGSVDPENDGITYGLAFYSDPGLTSLVYEIEGIAATNDTVTFDAPGNLIHGNQYYWRARSSDPYENSSWTDAYLITVMAEITLDALKGGDIASSVVYCDDPIEFTWRIANHQADAVTSVNNSLEFSSPDSAEFEIVSAEWYNPSFDWNTVFDLYAGATTNDGTYADTVTFGSVAIFQDGFEPGRSEQAWQVQVQIDCSEQGKTICIDSMMDASPAGQWIWYHNDGGYQSHPGWDGARCFTIEQCCTGMRGDINGDGSDADISDLIYLVTFMFGGGPSPTCLSEANVNGDPDGHIDITDLVYLVGYMFAQGPQPLACGTVSAPAAKSIEGMVPSLYRTIINDTTIISIETAAPLSGLQMSLYGEDAFSATLPEGSSLELFYHQTDNGCAVGILDIDGSQRIPKGITELIRIPGEFSVEDALAADDHFQPLLPHIENSRNVPGQLPQKFSLHQNYPNPFNPSTTIKYDLPKPGNVKISIFNVLGQEVKTIMDEHQAAGFHSVRWNGNSSQGKTVSSGVYFYRIEAGNFDQTKKMLLLK